MNYRNTFLADTEFNTLITSFRLRGIKYDPSLIATAELRADRLNIVLGDYSYATHLDPSRGEFIIDNPDLFLVCQKPEKSDLIKVNAPINPACIDFNDLVSGETHTVIKVNYPIVCELLPDTLTININNTYTNVTPTTDTSGLRTINGLLPDTNGNIIIKSVSPYISVTVKKH